MFLLRLTKNAGRIWQNFILSASKAFGNYSKKHDTVILASELVGCIRLLKSSLRMYFLQMEEENVDSVRHNCSFKERDRVVTLLVDS